MIDHRTLLNNEEAKSVVRQILRGLRLMHNHNLVHCDIKPENIMLHFDGMGLL
jgi:protein-serine/threonine kinase